MFFAERVCTDNIDAILLEVIENSTESKTLQVMRLIYNFRSSCLSAETHPVTRSIVVNLAVVIQGVF